MADESDVKLSTELIPSLYYDLIARVCAGVPFVLLLVCKNQNQVRNLRDILGPSGIVLLVGLCGYLLGLLLTPPAGLIAGVIQLCLKSRLKMKKLSVLDFFTELSRQYDEIALKDRSMGATLGKMAAERILCQNLFLGILVLVIYGVREICCVKVSTTTEIVALIFLGCLVIQRNVVFLARLETVYALVCSNSKPSTRHDS